MKYICTNCNYIYDESVGDREEEIDAGTRFYDLGDYFACPSCYEGSENFDVIKEEVNYIEDDETRDHLEIEHFPVIKIDKNILKVTVGRDTKHVMGDDHYISSISLCDEYGDVIEEKFLDMGDKPKVDFEFDDLAEFEIVVRCTFHGLWGFKFINS